MNLFNRAAWIPDFRPPHQPTPAPQDPTVPAGHERNSSPPVQAIRDAILASGVGVVDTALCRKVASYCSSTPNSSGGVAAMEWSGDTSIAGNALTLSATQLPPGRTGFFYYGQGRRAAPFGDGIRCIATPVHRILTPVTIDAGGTGFNASDALEILFCP